LLDEPGYDRVRGEGVRVVVGGGAAGGLPEEGYAGGVPAEGGDVVADPFEGEALVEEAEVALGGGVAGEAEDGDAVALGGLVGWRGGGMGE
jgi:hypothetical protein